jgi:hypothetical protein
LLQIKNYDLHIAEVLELQFSTALNNEMLHHVFNWFSMWWPIDRVVKIKLLSGCCSEEDILFDLMLELIQVCRIRWREWKISYAQSGIKLRNTDGLEMQRACVVLRAFVPVVLVTFNHRDVS